MNNRPIDEKIVKMSLDKSGFDKNVKETVSSLNSINDSVAKTGNIDLTHLTNATQGIQKRFSATGVVVASIINDLVKRTIDMGLKMGRALVDPIIQGGKTRALNIEQAQFQFEGLGMDVEKTMESALEAVKGTAFGLDEAAVIAAQFGATGMRAGDEMTEALRGISGVAAMTGSSYSDVGQIFATVAGNGRLMGNDLLRLGARGINAAATLGDAMGVTEQEVRKMVTAGEISFDIFANAMSDAFGEHATRANETYTGSLSNLRAALGRIGAAHYEVRFMKMRDLFNAMTPVVDDLAAALGPVIDFMNNLTTRGIDSMISFIERIDFTTFSDLGGMSNLVNVFKNVLASTSRVLDAFRLGFKNVFPGSFMDTVMGITEALSDLSNRMRIGHRTSAKLAVIFEGVFSVFKAVATLAWQLGSAILGIVPKESSGNILDFVVRISELAIRFNQSVQEGNFLTDVIRGLAGNIRSMGEVLSKVINGTIDFAGAIRSKLGPMLQWVKDMVGPLVSEIGKLFGDNPLSAQNIVGGTMLFGIVVVAQKIYDIFLKVGFLLEGLSFNIASTFRRLGTSLSKFIGEIKYSSLMKIAISIGILAVSLKLLESMDLIDITEGIIALTASMGILAGGMMAIEKLNFVGGIRASITILAMATAMTIMANAIKKISDLDPSQIGKGIGALAGMMVTLSIGIMLISGLDGKIKAGSLQIIALATSMIILSIALENLSAIDTEGLIKSIVSLAAMFGILAGFMALTKGTSLNTGAGLGILALAGSMFIMANAIERMAEIDTQALIKGLIGIGVVLGVVGGFAMLAGGGTMLAAGVGMVILAGALNLMVIPIRKLGDMSWEELRKGLAGIAVAMGTLAVVAVTAGSGIMGAAAIMLMSVALSSLIVPVAFFANLSWQQLLMGLVGMAAALGTIAGVSMLLTPAIVPMLGFSAALLAIGAAVALVGAGIALFGTGLAALAGMTAGSIVAIIGSLNLLIEGFTDLITNIVKLVVKLAMALIDGLVEIVPAIIIGAGVLIRALIETIAEHLPDFVILGYDIVIGVLKGVEEKGPELQMQAGKTMVAMVEGMADAISENRTPLINAFVRLMGEVILVVIEAGTATIEALFGWIPGVEGAMAKVTDTAEEYMHKHFDTAIIAEEKGKDFADGLESQTPVVSKSTDIFLKGSLDKFGEADFKTPGSDSGLDWTDGMMTNQKLSNTAGEVIAGESLKGVNSVDFMAAGSSASTDIATGIRSNRDLNYTEGQVVANQAKSGAESVNTTPTGKGIGTDLSKGINSTKSTNRTAGTNIAKEARTGASSVSVYNTGENFGIGFGNGIGAVSWYVRNKATSIARTASSAVSSHTLMRSPSRLLHKYGVFFSQGFGNGIGSKTREVAGRAKNLASSAVESLKRALDVPEFLDREIVIKAILDDSDLDPSKFAPRPEPIPIRPNVSYTRDMANMTREEMRQNRNNPMQEEVKEREKEVQPEETTPAIIQVVTPDRREIARWVVDDITSFQELRLNIQKNF